MKSKIHESNLRKPFSMSKTFTKLFFLLIAISFQSKAQWTTLLSENCDASVVPSLPTGFTSLPIDSVGFISDSTNMSDCAGASGLKNLVIKNISSSTGDYTLNFPSINTIGKTVVSISWNSRVSSNFLSSGSSINSFEYSLNGTDWNNLPYQDNAANSLWAQVNNASTIDLPAAALDKTNVQLRLNVHIVNNANGTYRLDDILVRGYHENGNVSVPSINSSSDISVYPNPSSGNFYLNSKHNGTIEIFNCNGKRVVLSNCKLGETIINSAELPSGLYIVRFADLIDGKIYSVKWMHI